MDFVSGLSSTLKGSDTIWVIVDRLTKSAHFIPIKTSFVLQRLTEIYIEMIVKLHSIPSSIVSGRDSSLTSKFLGKLI